MHPDNGEVINDLEQWIARAARRLSSKSRASVRAEIQEHYDLALEEELANGVAPEEARRRALASLGDAKEVNRGYRRTLLTSQEAHALCVVRWQTDWFRRHTLLRTVLTAIPFVLLAASVGLYLREGSRLALFPGVMGLLMFLFLTAQFLPLHRRRRARVFRILKYIALGALFLAMLPPQSWFTPFWFAWWAVRDWRRASLRRKLPESLWPESLYI